MNRSKRYFLTMVLLGLTFFYGISFAARTEYGSDNDGFQRPKDTKTEPNKTNEEKVKKEATLPAKEQSESKGSIYEDMDGFKRPKKDQ